jgi:hypothetical protein
MRRWILSIFLLIDLERRPFSAFLSLLFGSFTILEITTYNYCAKHSPMAALRRKL